MTDVDEARSRLRTLTSTLLGSGGTSLALQLGNDGIEAIRLTLEALDQQDAFAAELLAWVHREVPFIEERPMSGIPGPRVAIEDGDLFIAYPAEEHRD